MANSFIIPASITYGPRALTQAAATIARMGSKALIVTDHMMGELGNLKKLTDVLDDSRVAWAVYDAVNSEPTDMMVERGISTFRNECCDFIIALGGGSPIDTMKAIAMCVSTGRAIASFMGELFEGPICPMVAIPTTAGTGSEATKFTIITDTVNDVKMLIAGTSLMPSLAIVDPEFTRTAPASVTAATGVDALCHAIEAYTSRKAQPMAQTFALSAAKRILSYLERCVLAPDDIEARTQMSIAATEAGIAFNNSSVTIIHGMSRPIGALFHIPHGLSNAILMEECLTFALDGAYDRFAEIARYCDVSQSRNDEEAARHLIGAVHHLLRAIQIPSLEDCGVDRIEFERKINKMAHDAEESGSPANTLKAVTITDMCTIYRNL